MIWTKSIGTLEIFFILAFILLYIFYAFRMIYIARIFKTSSKSVYNKLVLRSLYFTLFIIALLGPSFGDIKQEIKSVGKDILIAVDLSESMNANDIQPTRLEKVKYEMKKLAEAFSSDRIGVIMFSNEAFMACPLTYDQGAINLFIETLNTNLVPSRGTDFAPPIEMALKKLKEENDQGTQQKSKVIILISDGEDFGENTLNLAKKVKEAEIKLFTLGIGTSKGSKIKTPYGYKTDRTGKEVVSKLNARDLKKLALTTGGKYYEINDRKNDVNRLIGTIENIEGELRDTRVVDVTANRYFYFLGAAILLLFIDVMWRVKTIRI